MANDTSDYNLNLNLPARLACKLTYQDPLIAGVSDSVLATFLPSVVYAISSLFFYWVGELNLFDDRRIHPSEEELKRNHVSRLECLRGVVRYHAMAITVGLLLSYGETPPMTGNHDCDVYDWAVRVRHARKAVPWALALVGVDAKGLASAYFSRSAALTSLLTGNPARRTKEFTTGEMQLASLMVQYGLSAFQYLVALIVVDTWIYFTHRVCHMNKTLYRTLSLFRAVSSAVRFFNSNRNLTTSQEWYTPNTIAYTCRMPLEPCTLTGWKAFSSTSSASS